MTLTALINASLFGSKPNPGKLQLPKEGQQDIVQTTTEVDLLPYWARQTMRLFNMASEVQNLKKECILRQEKSDASRIQYGKALSGKQHTNNHIIIKKKFNPYAIDELRMEYEELFQKSLNKALQSSHFEKLPEVCFSFVTPYVRYFFYELIEYPVDRELLSIFQKTSIARLQEHLNSYNIVQLLVFIYDEKVSQNPYIKMLQDCSLDLLKVYKDQTGDLFAYAHAHTFHQINKTNELEKLRKECDEITTTVLESLPKLENLAKMISDPTIDYELKTITENSNKKYNLFKTLSKEISDIKQKHKLTDEELAKVNSILEASLKDLKKDKQKTQAKMSTQKQAPLAGRKAIPNTFSAPETQKQMKKEPTSITQKDLDDKFGEHLEKSFKNLEEINIDFDSEEDWEIFIKKADVKFEGESHRHGSHESQEIFFDLEGQNTKGQLLTYHVHSKDTPEKITRKIRVTRRVQK